MAQLQITLVRSLIGRPENQRQTVQTHGLGKLHSSVVREDNVATRGMINTVIHLIEVKEI
jgi:large subunit ribosomal protein L30